MSVRPIDMISMPSKSQEVSQLQHQENARMTHIQDHIVQAHDKEVMRDSQQTTETNKTENHEFDYETANGREHSSGERNRKKKKKEEEKEKEEKIKISNFDITI